ncbi:YwiC-like protein [Bifidobacterium vansinderenii]|uniref:YwiC-like protein n=2 Tax=Bifidobacterium vansinderenii TaxID=1984871 RepID=A0A229W0L8_9BIFI|nr:YwiC-like protein [Bifidobacterium vansinderenii]
MAILPALTGLGLVGASVTTIWLLACWILCYCVQYATARWLKSRRSRRYLPPMIVYMAVLAAIGVPFILLYPAVLLWSPLFAVLAALSFIAAWKRQERSIWANIAVILAACSMTVVICWIGDPSLSPHSSATQSLSSHGIDLFSPDRWSISAWLAIPLPHAGLIAAAVFALYEFGSVLFVKTMIRERGSRVYLTASWIWHATLTVAGFTVSPWLGSLGLVLLIRAVTLPVLARHRKIKPVVVGLTELVTILLACVLTVTVVPPRIG